MDGQECLSVLQKSNYGKPPYTYTKGSPLCNKMSFLAHLDPSYVPCDAGCNPVQSLSWQLFNNDGLILFYIPEAQLVRFWAQSTTTTPQASVPSLTLINTHTWATPSAANAFQVTVPVTKRPLHAQVIAGLFCPFDQLKRASDPKYHGNVFRGVYKNSDSVALAQEFVLGGSTILCVNPNALKKAELIKDITGPDTVDSAHQQVILAGMKSTQFVCNLIEADERMGADALPPSVKADEVGDCHPYSEPEGDIET